MTGIIYPERIGFAALKNRGCAFTACGALTGNLNFFKKHIDSFGNAYTLYYYGIVVLSNSLPIARALAGCFRSAYFILDSTCRIIGENYFMKVTNFCAFLRRINTKNMPQHVFTSGKIKGLAFLFTLAFLLFSLNCSNGGGGGGGNPDGGPAPDPDLL